MEYDNIFYRDGYQLARGILDKRTGGEIEAGEETEAVTVSILEIVESAYEAVDGLVESFILRCRRENRPVDCRKGCAWCCSQALLVSTHELMYLFTWMKVNLGRELIRRIEAAAVERDSRTREMRVMEFIHYTHPCPLLDNDACLVYPVRPMACRIYLSSDVSSCREQHDHPDDPGIMADLYEFPLRAGRLINEGIRKAFTEKGIVTSEWLIESLLNQVFADPDILSGWIEDLRAFFIREMSREENLYLRKYLETKGSSGAGG